MTAAKELLSVLEWNWTMVDAALDGLDETTLARRPAAQCNSIAWILWHMNRVVDMFIHRPWQSQPQLWERDGWQQQFEVLNGISSQYSRIAFDISGLGNEHVPETVSEIALQERQR